jgi:bifunctional enzyme CysN/CysC
VQYVNRPNLNFRGYCGTVASGVVRKGDLITALPSGKSSRIKSIVTYDEEIETAFAPMAITLTLENEIDISRGDMLVHSDNKPGSASTFEADLVWMADAEMRPGIDYDLKIGSKTTGARIKALQNLVDVNTLNRSPAPSLKLNEIGRVEIQVEQALSFDDYQQNRATGSFILIDRLTNVTVGAGMIAYKASKPASNKSHGHGSYVTPDERAARFGQQPVTLLFIGLSGSGKTTLAHAVERELFEKGHASAVLDGKTMRQGISGDLDHSSQGRAENLVRSAHVAQFLNDSGLICCASFVAPTRASRERAANIIGANNCLIVYLNPPLAVCQQRDPSGLYSASTTDIPGVSFEYETPTNAALELDTSALTPQDCVEKVMRLLGERGVL